MSLSFFLPPSVVICVWTCHHDGIGADKGFCDGVGGRRRLLPRVQRHRLGGQRGECPPLDQAVGSDYTQKHPGNKAPP